MATNYTTRTTTRPPEPNGRSIAVSRKVQIGGSDGTIVSQQSIQTKQLNADIINAKKINVHDLNGESTDLLKLLNSKTPESSGIDIIGSETFTGATKIQFQGDNVYISKKDDGTIVIRIGNVSINPLKSVSETTNLTSVEKYAFGPDISSSGESWSLPSNTLNGTLVTCHNIDNLDAIQQISLNLTGADGGDFGVEDIVSEGIDPTLSINLVYGAKQLANSHTIASVKLDGTQTDVNGWTFENPTKIGDGIKFDSITYTMGKDKIAIIKQKIGNGNTWKFECVLGSTTASTTEKYAYSDFSPEVIEGTALSVTNYYGVDPNDAATISDDASSCVSGISYTSSKTPTGIVVTPFQSVKNVDRIGCKRLERGKITVSIDNQVKYTKTIDGTNSDSNTTVYPKSDSDDIPYTFYLGSDCADKTYNVTQTMYGSDDTTNIKYESVDYKITADGDSSYNFKEDEYNTINFYTEDKSGDYNRVLGYIDENGDLVIADVSYDSTQTVVENTGNYATYYNCQAVVQNGKLIHPSKIDTTLGGNLPKYKDKDEDDKEYQYDYEGDITTPRYYVRKIVRNKESTSQNTAAKLNIKGFTALGGSDKEIWLFSALDTSMYDRLDLSGSMFNSKWDTDGIKFNLEGFFSEDQYENAQWYIVIKLNNDTASVQGPIEFITQ